MFRWQFQRWNLGRLAFCTISQVCTPFQFWWVVLYFWILVLVSGCMFLDVYDAGISSVYLSKGNHWGDNPCCSYHPLYLSAAYHTILSLIFSIISTVLTIPSINLLSVTPSSHRSSQYVFAFWGVATAVQRPSIRSLAHYKFRWPLHLWILCISWPNICLRLHTGYVKGFLKAENSFQNTKKE